MDTALPPAFPNDRDLPISRRRPFVPLPEDVILHCHGAQTTRDGAPFAGVTQVEPECAGDAAWLRNRCI